jgi:hypothetical protein
MCAFRHSLAAVEEDWCGRPQWWHHAVFYEVYPRSYADSNNDGVGDLKDHLSWLFSILASMPSGYAVLPFPSRFWI